MSINLFGKAYLPVIGANTTSMKEVLQSHVRKDLVQTFYLKLSFVAGARSHLKEIRLPLGKNVQDYDLTLTLHYIADLGILGAHDASHRLAGGNVEEAAEICARLSQRLFEPKQLTPEAADHEVVIDAVGALYHNTPELHELFGSMEESGFSALAYAGFRTLAAAL